jgi:hypothetical protein
VQEKRERLVLRVPQAKLDRLDRLASQVPLEKLVSLVHQEAQVHLGRLVKLGILVQVVALVRPDLREQQE